MPINGEYAPSTSDWAREQAEDFEATNGERAGDAPGSSIVVITSIGAKSGKLRKTPLMRVEYEGEYAAVASRGGAPENPDWFHNFKKNPHVELQDGAVKKDYLAREVSGEERDIWWQRAVDVLPSYADFQKQTERIIPVFVLTEIAVE